MATKSKLFAGDKYENKGSNLFPANIGTSFLIIGPPIEIFTKSLSIESPYRLYPISNLIQYANAKSHTTDPLPKVTYKWHMNGWVLRVELNEL